LLDLIFYGFLLYKVQMISVWFWSKNSYAICILLIRLFSHWLLLQKHQITTPRLCYSVLRISVYGFVFSMVAFTVCEEREILIDQKRSNAS
jgi:hypothetical protein